MLRKKIIKAFIISLSVVLSISIILIINNFIVISRIYYRVYYEVNLPNSDEIIDKTENFDYLKYLKMHDPYGNTQNLSKFNINYIDREFIDFLKGKINRDNKEFHLNPFLSHNFIYIFNATAESKLYFSYNNNTIFNATYENQNAIFIVDFDDPIGIFTPNGDSPTWFHSIGSWYINFTQVPYVANQSSTILLNNTILVKMNLIYDYLYGNVGGESYCLKQNVIFNSNLQVIFIYAPATQVIVA
ncbi:MAG: hypothetical protein MUP85_24645 [Candidatus Lokiarchaeota archaeon]|nr:hypothetical protein [Candidatus Lokiarchaeota archaeon]